MKWKEYLPLIAMIVTAILLALVWLVITALKERDKEEDNCEGLNCESCMIQYEKEATA